MNCAFVGLSKSSKCSTVSVQHVRIYYHSNIRSMFSCTAILESFADYDTRFGASFSILRRQQLASLDRINRNSKIQYGGK